MAIEVLNTRPLFNGALPEPKSGDHKLNKHRLEKLDRSLSEIPQYFDLLLNSLRTFCSAGTNLGLLLEAVLEDTPLISVAIKYKESCRLIEEKYTHQEDLLKPAFVSACKRLGTTISGLRNSYDHHAELLAKSESVKAQLKQLEHSDSASAAKLEQADLKYQSLLRDLTTQEVELNNSVHSLDTEREKSFGSCFLNIIEAQSQLMSFAMENLSSLALHQNANLSSGHPLIKEATLNWLAAAQVNKSLHTKCFLSPNDVQNMAAYGDGLATESVKNNLNHKVDKLLKSYLFEMNNAIGTSWNVQGGFHFNSKGIGLALKERCGSLEVIGAGAPVPSTKVEMEEQIERDVPYAIFNIGGKTWKEANRDSEDSELFDNMQEKLIAIQEVVSNLPCVKKFNVPISKIKEFSFHIINECCTRLTNNACKTSVQLLYGITNLVIVKLSDDVFPIELNVCGDSVMSIKVDTTWWLVEDYVSLSALSRPTGSFLAVVKATYSLQMDLMDFMNDPSYIYIPTISVECTCINSDYFTIHSSSIYSSKSSPGRKRTSKKHSHKSYLKQTTPEVPPSSKEDLRLPSGRLPSSDGENSSDTTRLSTGTSPSSSGHSDNSRGRGMRSNLQRSLSNDSISTANSMSTVKANPFEPDEDILSVLHGNQKGLTQTTLMAHTKTENKTTPTTNPRRYSSRRKEHTWMGDELRGGREEKRISDKTNMLESSYTLENHRHSSSLNFPTSEEFESVFKYLDKDDAFSNEKINEDMLQPSQVMCGDMMEQMRNRVTSHHVSNSTGSLDSGIVIPKQANGSSRRNERFQGGYVMNDDKWGLFHGGGIGPFYPPVSSDSDSESASGRDSRDTNFRSSHEELPGRSASSASFHAMPTIHRQSLDSDSISLPDDSNYQKPFNQAPGSHRAMMHRRHPSISSYDEPFDSPRIGGAAFSQDVPMPRSQDEREFHHHAHFSSPYEHESIMRGTGGQSQFLSDPYPAPPNFPPIRPSGHFPPMNHPHPPPPMPPRPQYWDNSFGGGPNFPAHMMGPPPPPPRGPHPPHPDMYRAHNYTPDMSPAPSPHPTPPTTPPPSHHPPMMGMQPSPMRMGPRPHPMPHRVPPPHGPPPMRPDYHVHPLPNRGMPPIGHMGPHPHVPHPPRMPPPSHMPPHLGDWMEQPRRHH